MGIQKATVTRIRQLCIELGISYTQLARAAGVSPSTVYSLLAPTRKVVRLSTVMKLVDGISYYKPGFTIIDFFNDPLFRNLEQEIK